MEQKQALYCRSGWFFQYFLLNMKIWTYFFGLIKFDNVMYEGSLFSFETFAYGGQVHYIR